MFVLLMTSATAVQASLNPLVEPFAESVANPSPRAEHGMAYDAQSDRVIFFGGWDQSERVQGDTWAYDFNSNAWSRRSPAAAPSDRAFYGMAHDAESDRVILFGGVDYNDTWAYDFDTDVWTRMNPIVAPSPRLGLRMAYDSESDRVVLFGGYVCDIGCGYTARYNDTWLYDFNTDTWTNVTPAVGPSPAAFHALAYDAQSDRIILFGGVPTHDADPLDETWAFDVNTNAWENRNPVGTRPSARWIHDMTYDSQSDRIVLFSGLTRAQFDLPHSQDSETWVYNFIANTWTQLNPGLSPPGRLGHKMAYDVESDRIVLFGGEWPIHGSRNNETWVYDRGSNTWTQVGPVASPPPAGNILLIILIAASAGIVAVAVAVLLWRRRGRKDSGERAS